jgi:hypothetical protein
MFFKILAEIPGDSILCARQRFSQFSPKLVPKPLFVIMNQQRHLTTTYLHKEQALHGTLNVKGFVSLNLYRRSGDQEEDLLSDHGNKSAEAICFLLIWQHNITEPTSLYRTSQRRRKPATKNYCILAVYAPMIYTALYVMFMMRAYPWASGRGLGRGHREFLSPVKWH